MARNPDRVFNSPASTQHVERYEEHSMFVIRPRDQARRASGPAAHSLIGDAGGQSSQDAEPSMQVKVVVHEAEEGGFWAEVPALPGCVSQGETMDALLANVREAIAAWLATEPPVETGAEAHERRTVVELSL
jgi:predicted RNase H-like HicB family nuclease